MIIKFTIPGIPQQQGSKRYVGNGVSIEANKNLKPWRYVAIAAAIDATAEWHGPTFVVPIVVEARCYFPRPKGHYGTGRNANQVKESAPHWHASAPDLDKLMRAIGDVLTQSQIILDDRLIVRWNASKEYGDPRVDLIITDADQAAVDLPEVYE